jgi:hypothetical protein
VDYDCNGFRAALIKIVLKPCISPYDLDQIADRPASAKRCMWQPISTAPFDRDPELAVIDTDGPHSVVFPLMANGMKINIMDAPKLGAPAGAPQPPR